MLYYALVFLVVGLIAGALNLAGVSAVAVQISWILFLIGIVLVAIHVITGRSARGGSSDRFVGKVQERYGYGDEKRALMKWADAWHEKSAPKAVEKKPR